MIGPMIYIELGRVLLYDYNLVSVSNRYEVEICFPLGVFLFFTQLSSLFTHIHLLFLLLWFIYRLFLVTGMPLSNPPCCKKWPCGSGSCVVGV